MDKHNYLPHVRCRGYEGDLISVEQTFCESVLEQIPQHVMSWLFRLNVT